MIVGVCTFYEKHLALKHEVPTGLVQAAMTNHLSFILVVFSFGRFGFGFLPFWSSVLHLAELVYLMLEYF